MKKYLIISALILSSIFVEAQSYSFVKTIEENALQVAPGKNGIFYSVSWEPNCPDDYIVIRYFSKTGDVVNSFKSPPYTGSFNSIHAITNNENNIVLYLRLNDINHLIYEFDSTGTLVWNNNLQFTNPVVKYTKLILSPTGYYLLGNTYTTVWADSSQAVITKLSTTGIHQWTKYYRMNNSAPASTHFNDMLYLNDSLLCAGRYYYTGDVAGQAPFRPVISRLDTSGNVVESFYYMVDSSFMGFDEYEFIQLDKTPSGNFYLVGNNFGNEHALFKMNSSLNIEWIMEKLSGRSTAMCAGYNEDVFISPEGEYRNFILQFDPSGQVTGNHVTKNPSSGADFTYGHVTNLKRHDCGFLFSNNETIIVHTDKSMTNCLDSSVTGFTNYYPVSSFYRGVASLSSGNLTSFNEYGMTQVYSAVSSTAVTHCSSAFSCNGTAEIENIDKDKTDVFPNPANEFLFIILPESLSCTNIILSDINGRIIRNEKISTCGTHRFSLSGLSGGFYLLKLISIDRIVVRKIFIDR